MSSLFGPTVSAAWLEEHLGDDGLVVVDSRWSLDGGPARAAFDDAHIPSAVFADLDVDLSAPASTDAGRHPLPTPDAFADAMARLGVGDDSRVVVYDDAGGVIAARLWWMLDVIGRSAAVLDGGLAAWSGPMATGPVEPASAVFSPVPWPANRVITKADLAASLLHDPPVLFLDEPTIGLDILSREAIRDFIKEINQKRKTTILLTTHDMQDIEYLANRLILLDKGRIQYDGGVDEFTRQYTREKILTVRLETACDPDIFARAGFQVKKQHSPLHFELVTGAEGSVGPLIEAITGGGGRIQEINVRRQDLADTLKLMYSGSKAEF